MTWEEYEDELAQALCLQSDCSCEHSVFYWRAMARVALRKVQELRMTVMVDD